MPISGRQQGMERQFIWELPIAMLIMVFDYIHNWLAQAIQETAFPSNHAWCTDRCVCFRSHFSHIAFIIHSHTSPPSKYFRYMPCLQHGQMQTQQLATPWKYLDKIPPESPYFLLEAVLQAVPAQCVQESPQTARNTAQWHYREQIMGEDSGMWQHVMCT